MQRNVEIKARVRDLKRILFLSSQVSKTKGEEIIQHDVFYNANEGRLKLRRDRNTSATLIFYNRSDINGPKLSEYNLCSLSAEQADQISNILANSLGLKGEVKKKRLLFMAGQTRIHIDSVEGLGDFMELEVMLRPEQSLEEGQQIAKKLQLSLEVCDEDLLTGAYVDFLKA